MRNLKRVLSLALACVMVIGMMVMTTGAADIADIDEVKNVEAVEVMAALGVLEGDENGVFNPEGILTREQAAKIICYMLMGADKAEKLAGTSNFTDVAANRWSAPFISYCASLDIISGYNGEFNPTGKLTDVAFGKMLLVALGYDAQLEGYVNNKDWATNIGGDMIEAGINNGAVTGAAVTRESAAQMAFNTLTATLVDYTGGTNITTSDGTSITVDADCYNVGVYAEGAGAGYDTINQTPYTQFCEKYFKNLTLNPVDNTDDGRPAYTWSYDAVAIGSYNYAPTFTWTTEKKAPVVAKTLKNYTAAVAGSQAMENNQANTTYTGVGTALNTGAIAGLTGNGHVVEIYTDGTEITDIVVLTTTATTVNRVITTKGKEAVVLGNGCTIEKKEGGSNFKFYDVVSGLKAGDTILTIVDGGVATTLIDVSIPETVTGKITYVDHDKKAYTVDDEVYEANKGFAVSIANTNLGNVVELVLDNYGYIIAEGTPASTASNAAYVLETSRDGSVKAGYTFSAKVLFTDGTVEWIEVSELDGKAYGAAGNTFVADFVSTPYVDKFIMVDELADGTYSVSKTLATGYTQVGLTTGDDVVNGTSAIKTGVNGSNATIFLMENKNGTFTSYTGIKNVPDVTMGATGGEALVKSTYASVIVITSGTVTSDDADLVFVYDTTVVAEKKVGPNTIEYYNAIVNGENTIVAVESGAAASIAVALYVNNTYTNGYISTLGTAYAADGDDDTAVVVEAAPATVTLTNGILTVGATPYVVDDNFVAYEIDTTGMMTSVADLNLTHVANADYDDAGDLAFIVYDEDGVYVTCAFFLNAA